MSNYIYILLISILFVFSYPRVYAQTGSGSMTVENSKVTIIGGTTELRFSQGTYFGPEANWVIDGTLEIWSEQIWIAPGTTFNGGGKIIIHNPGSSPYYEGTAPVATYIDGNNGEFINPLIEHRNDKNIILHDVVDPGYGTSNPSGPQAAQLNFAGTLDLAVNGSNVILNGHDLDFNKTGKIENFKTDRMIVTTNSISGHMIKEYAKAEAFTFPVGISEKDYTPAVLTPLKVGKIYVSVQDYPASNTRLKDRKTGMDRSWHIYASEGLQADISFQHNMGTNGTSYTDETATIGQYNSGIEWNNMETNRLNSGLHRTLNTPIMSNWIENATWFTKYSQAAGNFFIPNVFTPNGDGSNDKFVIVGLEEFDNADITIFNRWGNEVYRNSTYKNQWEKALTKEPVIT